MRTAPEPVQGPQRNDPWGGDAERFGLRNRLLGRQSWKSCLQGDSRPETREGLQFESGLACSLRGGSVGREKRRGPKAGGSPCVPVDLLSTLPGKGDLHGQHHPGTRPPASGGATRAPAEKGAGGEKPLCLLSTPLCLTVSPSLWPDNPGRLLGTLSLPHTRGGHGVSLSSVLDYSPFLAGYLNPAYASENSPEMKPSTVHPLGMPPAS